MKDWKPSTEEVESLLMTYYDDDYYRKYRDEATTLQYLYQTYRGNHHLNQVHIKVAVLEDFFAYHLSHTYQLAQHIAALNLDDRLSNGDATLIAEICKVPYKIDKDEQNRLYSFVSRYCNQHKAQLFPIYDQYSEACMAQYLEEDLKGALCGKKLTKEDLKDYPTFCAVVKDFLSHYNLRCGIRGLFHYFLTHCEEKKRNAR
jgi:hypothetical protein